MIVKAMGYAELTLFCFLERHRWWIDEEGDDRKGMWMRQGICRKGVNLSVDLVKSF